MAARSMTPAGELRERLTVLTLAEGPAGTWRWTPTRQTWAGSEYAKRKNVYSVHGIGTAGMTFVIRRQSLTLDQAVFWQGHHCLITEIRALGRSHLEVDAALVVVRDCADLHSAPAVRFPGVVTERYVWHGQEEPYAVNTLQYVLVTPKRIEPQPGRLVRIDGVDWPIRVAHTLDPHKNEYEIERRVDL